jgi:hypothetical protein
MEKGALTTAPVLEFHEKHTSQKEIVLYNTVKLPVKNDGKI